MTKGGTATTAADGASALTDWASTSAMLNPRRRSRPPGRGGQLVDAHGPPRGWVGVLVGAGPGAGEVLGVLLGVVLGSGRGGRERSQQGARAGVRRRVHE